MQATLAAVCIHVLALASPAAGSEVRQLIVESGHRGTVCAIAWSPDGRRVATGGLDGRTKLWDPATGRMVRELPRPWGRVTGLAFTDEVLIVGQVNARARVLDRRTGTWTHAVDFDRGGYCGVAVSRDGKRFACGGDRVVAVFDLATGREIVKIEGPRKDRFWAVALNDDGTELAAASDEKSVYLWRVEDGALLHEFRDHRRDVRGLAWPTATRLVAVDTAGEVRSHDRATGRGRLIGAGRSGDWGMIAATDTLIASAVDGAAVISGRGGDEGALRIATRTPRAVAFDPAGERLAIGADDGEVWIHDAKSGRRMARLHGPAPSLRAVAATAEGGIRTLLVMRDRRLFVVDIVTGKRVWTTMIAGKGYLWSALDPGGTHAAYGTAGARVAVTRLDAGEQVPFPAAARVAGPLALSAGANRLACCASASTIAVFDRGVAGASTTVPGDAVRGVLGLAFDPSGRSILFGGKGNLIRIIAVERGQLEVERGGMGFHRKGDSTPAHDRGMGWVRSLAVSPDGAQVLCGGPYDHLVLRSRKGLASVRAMAGHFGSVAAVAFSADGEKLVSAGAEGVLQIRDRDTGVARLSVQFLRSGGWVAIAPDGRWDATADAAKSCHWWSGNAARPLDFDDGRRVPGLVAAIMSSNGK